MRREQVERLIHGGLIMKPRSRRVQPLKPTCALAVVGEKAVDIAARNAPIRARRSVLLAILETQQRPRQVRPDRPADMHFIPSERSAALDTMSAHLLKRLVSFENRLAIEKAEPVHRARLSFGSCGVANPPSKHLVAAAKAENAAAATQMRFEVDIPARCAKNFQICDGGL